MIEETKNLGDSSEDVQHPAQPPAPDGPRSLNEIANRSIHEVFDSVVAELESQLKAKELKIEEQEARIAELEGGE